MDRAWVTKSTYDLDNSEGHIWMSFPSSDRNKITEDDYIILKKKIGTGEEQVTFENKYKVIDIQNDGANMDPFGQGFVSMSAPTKELEKLILGKQIVHDNNPAMNWMLSNVAIQEDPAGNLKVAKNKSKEKVDGIVALVMAIGEMMSGEDLTSVYDGRGILTF